MAKCAIISPQLLLHCLYSMGGIIQHIYISVLSENLKTSKPQNLKTSKPQNLKTSKPQNLKTSLCSITTVSVSYADTFGMIQQERQNNIINILGGHSYAM